MSTIYLKHHGILGQKWGIRRFQNPDGSLTAEGKKRYLTNRQIEQVHEAFSRSNYNDNISNEVFAITKADRKALKKAKNELYESLKEQKAIYKESKEILKDLERNDGNNNYYTAVSEIAASGHYKDVNDMTLEDISRDAWRGIFDDGQQSVVNAYSMYAYKNGKADELANMSQKIDDIKDKYRQRAEDYIQEALNEIGGENLSVSASNPNRSAAKGLVSRMINSNEAMMGYGSNGYALMMAGHAKSFTDQDKSSIAKAERIVSKLHNNKDAETWDLLNEAVDNLGLTNVKASELSSSDWKRINAEIDDLR